MVGTQISKLSPGKEDENVYRKMKSALLVCGAGFLIKSYIIAFSFKIIKTRFQQLKETCF